MSTPLRILCTGFWHDDNTGDAAIAEATVRLLTERWPHAEITVMSLLRCPPETLRYSARHLTEAVPGLRLLPAPLPDELHGGGGTGNGPVARAVGGALWLARLAGPSLRVLSGRPPVHHDLTDVDLVVSLGGCDLYDNAAVLAPFSHARMLTVLYPLWLARQSGVPVALFGHTLGPFPRRLGRTMARRMLGEPAWVSTRESHSRVAAEAIGIRNAVAGPDVAFALPTRPSARARAVLERFGGKTVGLVVRRHPHASASADDRLVAEFAQLGRGLLDRGDADHLAVVVQARGPTAVEDDRLLSRRLAAALPAGRVTVVDEDLAPGELAAVYGGLRLVVTVRLHAAILAMTAGTPAFAVAYFSTKTAGVMESIGGADAWCEHADFRAQTVLERFDRLVADDRVNDVRRRVAASAEALRNEVARWDVVAAGEAALR